MATNLCKMLILIHFISKEYNQSVTRVAYSRADIILYSLTQGDGEMGIWSIYKGYCFKGAG